MAGNVTIKGRIQFPRFAEADLAAVNPVLLDGEIVYESSKGRRKMGDGVKTWNELDYESSGSDTSESLSVPLSSTTSNSFKSLTEVRLKLTKTNAFLIVEFFVNGSGASGSRATWNNMLTTKAKEWIGMADSNGINKIHLSNVGASGITTKTVSVGYLSITQSTIELYVEGLGQASNYSVPNHFRTVCSLK